MPFQKGNKAALGSKGGGRKSAYKEHQDAKWHKEKWDNDQAVLELKKKIDSGKYSVKDMFLYKALGGEPRVLGIFANKILPDLTEMDLEAKGKGGVVIYVPRKKKLSEMKVVDEVKPPTEEVNYAQQNGEVAP